MNTFLDWLPDIGLGNIFILLLIVFFGAGTVVHGQDLVKQLRHNGTVRIYNLVVFCGGLFFNGVLSSAIVSNTRRDHWLRVGTPRYAVATVTRSYYSRSGRKFVFTYRAGGRDHETNGECGNASCPALGTRRYVRFAAQAPDVCTVLAGAVPDSVASAPPEGWETPPFAVPKEVL